MLGTAFSFTLRLDGQTINAPGFSLDTWHHVAVVRTAAIIACGSMASKWGEPFRGQSPR